MCRKCHSFPCRSVATNSCHGGCWDISWIDKGTNEKRDGYGVPKQHSIHVALKFRAYQWRQTILCMPTKNRESTMGAGVRSSKCFAKGMHFNFGGLWEWRIRACYFSLLVNQEDQIGITSEELNLELLLLHPTERESHLHCFLVAELIVHKLHQFQLQPGSYSNSKKRINKMKE